MDFSRTCQPLPCEHSVFRTDNLITGSYWFRVQDSATIKAAMLGISRGFAGLEETVHRFSLLTPRRESEATPLQQLLIERSGFLLGLEAPKPLDPEKSKARATSFLSENLPCEAPVG